MIVGNKEDLINKDNMKEYFIKKGIKNTIFSSAKTGKGVDDIFTNLSQIICKNEL